MSNTLPKLHNAMWPGLVGKEEGTDHPPISLDRMLELTAAAEVDGQKFDGVDYFLFHPHTDPDASDDEFFTTDSLSHNTLVASFTGTPNMHILYLNVCINSTHVFIAMNSEEK